MMANIDIDIARLRAYRKAPRLLHALDDERPIYRY